MKSIQTKLLFPILLVIAVVMTSTATDTFFRVKGQIAGIAQQQIKQTVDMLFKAATSTTVFMETDLHSLVLNEQVKGLVEQMAHNAVTPQVRDTAAKMQDSIGSVDELSQLAHELPGVIEKMGTGRRRQTAARPAAI